MTKVSKTFQSVKDVKYSKGNVTKRSFAFTTNGSDGSERSFVLNVN